MTVVDSGAWKAPDPTDTLRGRGPILIDALSDHSATVHRDDGTTVVIKLERGETGQRHLNSDCPGGSAHARRPAPRGRIVWRCVLTAGAVRR